MKREISNISLQVFMLVVIFLLTQSHMLHAQVLPYLPAGESIVGDFSEGMFTQNHIYIEHESKNPNYFRSSQISWTPPFPQRIQSAQWKTNANGTLLVLLSNGSVYELKFATKFDEEESRVEWRYSDTSKYRGQVGSTGSETFEKVIGDAIYILSTSSAYVNRGSGVAWSADTAGLNRATIADLALDAAQNVYAVTGNGLFQQKPDSSTWVHNDALNARALSSVFVDRKNRIFVGSGSQGPYISTDGGKTWTRDTTGLGNQPVGKWGDDAYGNVYALSSHIYRSIGGTGPWTAVDGGILSSTVNAPTIRGIAGDSVLYAATSFGLFASSDQGNTWIQSNAGIAAESFTGFSKTSTGKWFTSDNLGIFSRNPADTFWTKSYPAAGYLSGQTLRSDGVGNIYTVWGGLSNKAQWVFKSSDNGQTWNPDTVGLTRLNFGTFIVDEAGGQHIATSQFGSFPTLIYTKPLGGIWALDTAGFKSSTNSYNAAIASDRHGYLYVSGSYFNGSTPINAAVMRRRIAGGPWSPDTVGLSANTTFSYMTPDKNGNMIGAVGRSLYRRANGLWSLIPLPSVLSLASVQSISVDSSGALFASFGDFSGGRGVYFTTNQGASWTYAGLDSIGSIRLVSYGDSTFASTTNGLFILTRKSVVASGIPATDVVPSSFHLFQNYPNPFNPSTKFDFRISSFGFVTLTIFDVLGREVATLVYEALQPGTYTVPWDASRFSSGVYFYRLNVGSFTETRKLVLLK